MTSRCSFAADFDNVDVAIPDATPLKLAPQRKLWDLNGDYYDERFICPVDAIYNFTCCFALVNLVNVGVARLHIYQNGELWATVAEKQISGQRDATFLQAACPSDGLFTNGDYFEIYVEITPQDPESPVAGAVSGSREKSFMGWDLLQLVEASEIDSAD